MTIVENLNKNNSQKQVDFGNIILNFRNHVRKGLADNFK